MKFISICIITTLGILAAAPLAAEPVSYDPDVNLERDNVRISVEPRSTRYNTGRGIRGAYHKISVHDRNNSDRPSAGYTGHQSKPNPLLTETQSEGLNEIVIAQTDLKSQYDPTNPNALSNDEYKFLLHLAESFQPTNPQLAAKFESIAEALIVNPKLTPADYEFLANFERSTENHAARTRMSQLRTRHQ